VKTRLVTAGVGAAWEAALVQACQAGQVAAQVLHRCYDLGDLLAVAAAGQAEVAVVAAGTRWLDHDALARLAAAGLAVVGVASAGDEDSERRLRQLGLLHVASDADPPDALVERARAALAAEPDPGEEPPEPDQAPAPPDGDTRRVLAAVWGPKGAPGRTTVAVNLAFEATAASGEVLLVDADTYGGAVAHTTIQEHRRWPTDIETRAGPAPIHCVRLHLVVLVILAGSHPPAPTHRCNQNASMDLIETFPYIAFLERHRRLWRVRWLVMGEVQSGVESVRTDPHFLITILGKFSLCCGNSILRVPKASQRLLACLALRGRVVERAAVAGTLWPDTPESHAYSNLRSALSRLQSTARKALEISKLELGLAESVAVDIRHAQLLARRLLDPTLVPEQSDLGMAGATVLSTDLLPDWYDDWVLLEAENWRQLRLHALEALAGRLIVAGRWGEAAYAAGAAVRTEPLRESARATLIQLHLAEGNQAEAVQEFRRYRTLLNAELGLEPTPRLYHLMQGIHSS
jgi:DNA-binding SARP family transcriptional activator